MATCCLCNKVEATKKNSHILPHFLIKTAINKGGSNQRDYELTFSFSEDEFVDTFFGRSITLDTIEEYKGRELTEEEIKKENPFAMDFFFCPSCETNISVVEDYFAQEVYQKLQKSNFEKVTNDKKGNRIVTVKADLQLVLLFVYSIFFRCSVSRYHGFDLKGLERKFRKILAKYLDDSIEKIQQRIEKDESGIPHFPLITTFFESPVADDPTKNFVTILHSDKPFFVYLNDITFQLFTKEKYVTKSKEHCFGITDMISHKEAVSVKGDPLKITILDEAQLKKILTTVFESTANRQMKFFQNAFRQVHRAIFNSSPTPQLVDYFIQILITQDAPPGERYSKSYFSIAMYKACKTWYQLL